MRQALHFLVQRSSPTCLLRLVTSRSSTLPILNIKQNQRAFITLPWQPESKTLTVSRVLPYASDRLYNIIADVNAYSSFLPYCQGSTITKWSEPDAIGKKWPSEAQLKVG